MNDIAFEWDEQKNAINIKNMAFLLKKQPLFL